MGLGYRSDRGYRSAMHAHRWLLTLALGLLPTVAWGQSTDSLGDDLGAASQATGQATADSDGDAEQPPRTESEAAPPPGGEAEASAEAAPPPGGEAEASAEAARAYEPSSPFAQAQRDRQPVTYEHFGQFGLRLGLVQSFKAVSRYDDSPPCESDTGSEQAVCPVWAPLALDLALSFAVLNALEPFIWLRLGLGEESKTRTAAARYLGAGLRIYLSTESRFKLFFEPSVAVQLEGAADNAPDAKYSTDLFSRLQVGGQFDINRHVGVYLTLGPSVSFVRAIALGLEGNAGVQARFP